ncbi:FtsX-like permease family protein [Marinibacterium profundimaris]|uniref:ABC transporter permease n=1 Tax=Marinibacterium profundimaris TaxID=1679460 RepID=A0A225NV66_9RHOB|nr:FtsX-like permease family protein [Marinibacterium profundimaris]OWU78040.1 ABC transporter permease [Marinibacterium profundimaris]
MTRAILLALLAHWRRHPGQALTLVAGLALATALWTAVQAINAEARASYAEANSLLQPARAGTLTAPTGAIPPRTYAALRRAGWQVSPVLEGRLDAGAARVTLLGVDALTYPALPVPDDTADAGNPADVLLPPGRLFADPDTAAALTRADLPPVVPASDMPAGVVLTDIAVADRLLEAGGRLSRILVATDQPAGRPLLSDIAPDLVYRPAEAQAGTEGLTRSFHLNLTAFGLLSFAVGLFIVHGTIGLAFEQRRAILRTLRALGVPARGLALAMFAELLAAGLLAGLAGVGLGYVIAAALLPGVAATLGGLYGADVAGSLALRPGWIAAGLGMALGGVVLAGAHVLWKARDLPVLALTGTEAWRLAGARGLRLQLAAGVALILAGWLAVWLFDGLLAGFACLGGLLLGSALLLAPLLAGLLRIGARLARRPVADWLWSDMRAQLPGLSLALMALLLALATNIGVGTMVSSFRLTFTDWLDRRLSADLYISTEDDSRTEALRQWLIPRAESVLPIRSAALRLGDRPGRVYGVIDDPIYRATWPMVRETPGLWERLSAGEGVIINEQLHFGAGIAPGDDLQLLPGWTLPVVGIYADYGNPDPQAITSLDTLLAHVPDLPDRQLAVRSADPPALAAALRDAFDLPADAIMPQAQIKTLSLGIFDRTFLITGALNLLTLGVAGFAILTSLLTLWTIRLPQLAPAWAMGITRARLAWLEILRAVALAALTALLALPLGLLLAWTLLSVINVEAFGWRLPMYLFPLDWMRLLALALVAAALAALIPALRLRRLPPADLVKVFANVR